MNEKKWEGIMENWSDAPQTDTAAIKLPLILTMEKMGSQCCQVF